MGDNRMAAYNVGIIEEYRANGGKVEGYDPLVLLHHIGAKSGQARISPAVAVQDGASWLVAATYGGAPSNPAWYYNLLGHPDIEIETPDRLVAVHATELTGADRDAAYQKFTDMSPRFRKYPQMVDRVIPVLRLDPVARS
jgi:deazaflavin-dependent oxidoreductase (nitroreductase family)